MNKLAQHTPSSWKRWVPGILVSAIIIFVLIRLIDIDAFLLAIHRTNYLYVIIAILLLAVANLTRACAWRELLGRKISLKDAFCIVNEGYLLNQIVPRSGEIGRALLVNSVVDMNFFQVFSTILIERAMDLFITAVLFLATIGRAVALEWIIPVAIVILCVVAAGFLFLLWAIQKREKVENWCSQMEEKSPFFKKYISTNLQALINGAAIIREGNHFFSAVLWIVISWMLWVAITYLLLYGFIGAYPLWWAVFVQSVLAFGIALPSAPAGLGVYEGTLVAALSVFQIDREVSLSFAIIMHVIQLITIAVLGIGSLMNQGNSLRTLVDSVLQRLRTRRSENDE